MKKITLIACMAFLTGCSGPGVITGNSRSVTISNTYGQYDYSQQLADQHCAKFGRVSTPKSHLDDGSIEYECVKK